MDHCVVSATVAAHSTCRATVAVRVVDRRTLPPFTYHRRAICVNVERTHRQFIHNQEGLAWADIAFGIHVEIGSSGRPTVVESVTLFDEWRQLAVDEFEEQSAVAESLVNAIHSVRISVRTDQLIVVGLIRCWRLHEVHTKAGWPVFV